MFRFVKNISEALNYAFGITASNNTSSDFVKEIENIDKNVNAVNYLNSTGYGTGYRSVGAKIEYGVQPVVDEFFDRVVLVGRSRQSEFDSVHYKAMVYWLMTYVVGTGLNINVLPNWEILGIEDAKTKRKYQVKIEHRIKSILKSKEVDFLGNYNTGQFFRELYRSYVVDGDVFVQFIYEHKKTVNDFVLTPVKLRIIPTECISYEKDSAEGIKLDKYGREIGYYITENNYEDTSSSYYKKSKKKSVYYPKYTSLRQIQMIHLANRNRPLDLRGIPKASHIFHELEKIYQANVAELDAQLLNAQLFAVVERELGTENKSEIDLPASRNFREATKEVPSTDKSVLNTTNIVWNYLNSGEKLVQANSNRPNLNIPAFIDSILIPACSSMGIPAEVLKGSFNSNYSAARAAINQMWETVVQERTDFALNVISPFYESVITELVYSGELRLKGFLDDSEKRSAWLQHNITGRAIPTLDPTKEVEAMEIAVKNGFVTREYASRTLYGTNFRDNIQGIADEEELAKSLNVKLGEDTIKENTNNNFNNKQTNENNNENEEDINNE